MVIRCFILYKTQNREKQRPEIGFIRNKTKQDEREKNEKISNNKNKKWASETKKKKRIKIDSFIDLECIVSAFAGII